MVVQLLVDDRASAGLQPEHGFSAWIEVAGRRILFDTGQGTALARNAAALGIALESADALVLSHGHEDHAGGIPVALARGGRVEAYCHPAALAARWAVRSGRARPLTMPAPSRAALERLDDLGRVHWIDRPVELGPGVGLAAGIPRREREAGAGGALALDPDGRTPDPVADELALWVRTAAGLVVVVGCCHAGVADTLRHVRTTSGEARVHALVGGLHLGEASRERLARAAQFLAELAPALVVPCHCTGAAAVTELAGALGGRVQPGAAGMRFDLPLEVGEGARGAAAPATPRPR